MVTMIKQLRPWKDEFYEISEVKQKQFKIFFSFLVENSCKT